MHGISQKLYEQAQAQGQSQAGPAEALRPVKMLLMPISPKRSKVLQAQVV